jgi:hypothetical protein
MLNTSSGLCHDLKTIGLRRQEQAREGTTISCINGGEHLRLAREGQGDAPGSDRTLCLFGRCAILEESRETTRRRKLHKDKQVRFDCRAVAWRSWRSGSTCPIPDRGATSALAYNRHDGDLRSVRYHPFARRVSHEADAQHCRRLRATGGPPFADCLGAALNARTQCG